MSRKVQTAVKINKDRKGSMQILFTNLLCVTLCESTTRILKDTCCVNISSKLCPFIKYDDGTSSNQSYFVVELLYRFRDFLIPTENYIRYQHICWVTHIQSHSEKIIRYF